MAPEDFLYWRGTVDSKLDSLDTKIEDLCTKVDRLTAKLEVLEENLGNGNKYIEWRYLRDKLTMPLLLGFLTFIFFSVLPVVFVVIWITLDRVP